MKKAAKLLSLFVVLCMVLTLGAFASDEYDVNAARVEAFGIITAESESASGEASGSSESASVTYDHYIDASASYDTFEFDGSTYGASEGYLTVTVGGVEVNPADLIGTYENVVFTVTGQIPAFVDNYASAYRTALYYDENGLNEDLSVTAAVMEGTYDDNGASGIVIQSYDDNFEGVIASAGKITIDGLKMRAEGNGTNDFAGVGAGVAVGGTADVTVNDYEFIAHGVIRHGMFIGGDDLAAPPSLTVNGGIIVAGNPEDENGNTPYTSTSGMSMNSSPWMLGIEATPEVRTQLMASTGKATYNDCVILSSGWGVVSSDAVDSPLNWGEYTIQMEFNDCILDFTGTSGYISYAIGATHNTFNNCLIGDTIESDAMADTIAYVQDAYGYDIAYESGVEEVNGRHYNTTYALIIANETAGGTFDGVTYTGTYGVMYHKTNNVRYVPGAADNSAATYAEDGYTLIKDSTFYTDGAAILVKACTPVIYVENTKFESEKGVILQLATCDDPGMGSQYFHEVLDTSAPVEADPDYDPYDYNTKNFSNLGYQIVGMMNDVEVDFKDCAGDTALDGDIYNSISVSTNGEGMVWWGQNLIATFDNCEINGVVSSSTSLHNAYSGFYDADGNEVEASSVEEAIANGAVEGRITSANATYLGNMSNTVSKAVNNGVWAILTNGSVWNVPSTSYLTVLDVDATSTVNGIVTVDGAVVDVTGGGRWTGDIVVEPAAASAAAETEGDVPATDGTENQSNVLSGTAQPATKEDYDAYVAYITEYMTNYDGVGDGTFDDGARSMALGELGSVSFGADVNAFPFEMYVTVFGAMDYASFAGGAAPAAGGITPGTYTDGVNTLVIADDMTFVMDKAGENMDGAAFTLTVTGSVVDGEFVIDGLYDGDLNVFEMATADQIANDTASVYAAYNG